MRKMSCLCITSILMLLLLAGCKSSTRTINLPGAILETGPIHFIEAPFWGLAGSPNGIYYTRLVMVDDKTGRVEVCDYGHNHVKLSIPVNENGPLPIMFDRKGEVLYAITGDESIELDSKVDKKRSKAMQSIVAIDLESGTQDLIHKSTLDLPGLFVGQRNYDHSILVESGVILTQNGKIFRTKSDVLFDTQGNAWFKEAKKWAKLTPQGVKTIEAKAPAGLVKDQTHARGSLRLIDQKTELKRKGAVAYLSTIWLEDSRAKKMSAAVVNSCLDLLAYGFVPGRKAVYMVTPQGTFIIDYKVEQRPDLK